jgi:hypothetical protein
LRLDRLRRPAIGGVGAKSARLDDDASVGDYDLAEDIAPGKPLNCLAEVVESERRVDDGAEIMTPRNADQISRSERLRTPMHSKCA